MLRKIWLPILLFAAAPAWAVDVMDCLEDGNSIEINGTVINEHHDGKTVLVLLTDEKFCRAEYSVEQANFVITNTNVMRLQLLPGPENRQNLESFTGKQVYARGLIYKASAPEHKTPLIIEVIGVVVN